MKDGNCDMLGSDDGISDGMSLGTSVGTPEGVDDGTMCVCVWLSLWRVWIMLSNALCVTPSSHVRLEICHSKKITNTNL